MKNLLGGMLACFCMGLAMNAAALQDYAGYSLGAVRSSNDGTRKTSPGFTGMISARPNNYYGWEVQGGILGKAGKYAASGEIDFALAGFAPLGNSGVNLYAKAGPDAMFSSGGVFATGFTCGAGLEYQGRNNIARLGIQHFSIGKAPSLGANLAGLTFMVRLGD
jgi:opacity protein-like surface antigen